MPCNLVPDATRKDHFLCTDCDNVFHFGEGGIPDGFSCDQPAVEDAPKAEDKKPEPKPEIESEIDEVVPTGVDDAIEDLSLKSA